jgi:tryptophan synthase alpha chain
MARPTTRITRTFVQLRQQGRRALIPFITAGDPDLNTTGALLIELAKAGADVIELGLPFSDPIADGPVIQRASMRALRNCVDVSKVLEVVGEVRQKIDVPIVLFSYFNPLLQFGVKRLAEGARRAGVDGVLVTDLGPEASREFSDELRKNGLDQIFLVAPTSTDERLRLIADSGSGFIYAVSRAGVTGQQSEVGSEAERLVMRVREVTDLPVAVGFGISNSDHVREVWRYADAAVVGSAVVAEIERLNGLPNLVSEVGNFVRLLGRARTSRNFTRATTSSKG